MTWPCSPTSYGGGWRRSGSPARRARCSATRAATAARCWTCSRAGATRPTPSVAGARGASVRVQAGAPAEVQASPTMLRQAIENLIDNAAAYGGPDGVEVDVRPGPAAGQVEVVVADCGAAAQAPGGHGIGLFVVRRFLEESGGRSWVAPREGGGTLVGLRMALRPAAEPDPLHTAVNT